MLEFKIYRCYGHPQLFQHARDKQNLNMSGLPFRKSRRPNCDPVDNMLMRTLEWSANLVHLAQKLWLYLTNKHGNITSPLQFDLISTPPRPPRCLLRGRLTSSRSPRDLASEGQATVDFPKGPRLTTIKREFLSYIFYQIDNYLDPWKFNNFFTFGFRAQIPSNGRKSYQSFHLDQTF